MIGGDGVVLSGGQRQRIGLARALYGSPRLIILDEPHSNLDEVGDRALIAALHRIRLSGANLFVITHRTNIVSQLDRLMVMSNGGISLFGPRELVLTELNAQQAPKQAMQAETNMASVANGKDGFDEPHDPTSIN